MNEINNIKKAMTLAEILITLGVVGIVAAMTIPAVLLNSKKQTTVEKVKKAYTTLSQVVKQSEIDNGSNQDWDWGNLGQLTSRQSFDKYWAPYLKILKYCNTNAECGYKSGSYIALDNSTNVTIISPALRTTALLSDGTVIVVFNTNQITIDINGAQSPNLYGIDVFFFTVDAAKGLMPVRFDDSTYANTHCKSNSEGTPCAAKMMIDGWQIKDDYPMN